MTIEHPASSTLRINMISRQRYIFVLTGLLFTACSLVSTQGVRLDFNRLLEPCFDQPDAQMPQLGLT